MDNNKNTIVIIFLTYWIGATATLLLPIKNSPRNIFLVAIIGIIWSFTIFISLFDKNNSGDLYRRTRNGLNTQSKDEKKEAIQKSFIKSLQEEKNLNNKKDL